MSRDIWKEDSALYRYISWQDYKIDRKQYLELRNGCRTGEYSPEMLSKACRGIEFVEPWILLSVTKNISYDRLEFNTRLGRIPIGRTDFYGYRRRFYYNLDCLLKNEQGKCSEKEGNKK